MAHIIRTLTILRGPLLLAAAMLIEELALMLLFGVDEAHSGELGAVMDAAILTVLFSATYAVVQPRMSGLKPTRTQMIVNTGAIAIATFTIESASHLVWHYCGRSWPPLLVALADAMTMAATVPAFAMWLRYMDDKRSESAATSPRDQPSELFAVVGSIAFVALVATVTPIFVSMADDLSSETPQKLQRIVEIAGRQRMYAQGIGRLVAEGQRDAFVAGVVRRSDADQQSLNSLLLDYVDRTQPDADVAARLPSSPALLALRQKMIASAHAWLDSDGAQRARAGARLRQDIDAFVPAMSAAVSAVISFEAARTSGLAHEAYLMIVRLSGGLFILATLAPIIGLHMARKRQLLTALEQSRSMLAELSAIRSALDEHAIVGITDARGKIIHANDKFCRVSGYERDELLGQDHRMLNSGAHSKRFFVDMWRRIGRGERFHATICNRSKSGEHYWVETTIVPVLGSDGRPQAFISIRHDVTSLKRAQTELLAANIDLEERVNSRTIALMEAKSVAEEANLSKSKFLATMSHELRTPLTSIVAYAEVIEEMAIEEGRPTEQQDARTIVEASRHLLTLIAEILEFSKLEAGKLLISNSQFQVSTLLDEVVAAARPLVSGKSNDFRCNIQPDLPDLLSDQIRLRQCLINLLGNAAKFTSAGRIDLCARRENRNDLDGVCFEVRDTGIGMSPDTLANLFQPFRQADSSIERKYGGTGLGLAITRQLIETLHGAITVVSAEGKGSAFFIWIPLAPPRAIATTHPAEEAA